MIYVAYILEGSGLGYDIGGVAVRVELYLGTGLTALVLLLAATNQKLVIAAVERIIKIDQKLRNYGVSVSYKEARRFCILENVFMLGIFTMKGIPQIFSSASVLMGKFRTYFMNDKLRKE